MEPAYSCIKKLTIKRFRGLHNFEWRPVLGVNFILGGGDTGKSSILDAIALLLNPASPQSVSDTEYERRSIAEGFEIEAIMSLAPDSGINDGQRTFYPWAWQDGEAIVPAMDENNADQRAVYKIRAVASPELDLLHEIVQPDGDVLQLSRTVRRNIGVVRLLDDDRNDRELRLVQGSPLDRLLSDKGLRSRMASGLAEVHVADNLSTEAKTKLDQLNTEFTKRHLPDGLDLAITGSQGTSIASLVGLTAEKSGVQLPLANWGGGTRRLATMAIAEQSASRHPITLIDEVERGFEPYRQRQLIKELEGAASQVFLTTHSVTALSAASNSTLWFLDQRGHIAELDATKTAQHRAEDPEAFLARFTVVVEGLTEAGFVGRLLERSIGADFENLGVHICDGRGHEKSLGLLRALSSAGLSFGAFVDCEDGKHSGIWETISSALGPLFHQWPKGCTEEQVFALIPDEDMLGFITDPQDELTGTRLRSLADRLGIESKEFEQVRIAGGLNLRQVVMDVATGKVPPESDKQVKKAAKSMTGNWFKTFEGGTELADKAFALKDWDKLNSTLLPFCNAVRKTIGLSPIAEFK
jgi:putative ATP-dependent endonuclease of OLD family